MLEYYLPTSEIELTLAASANNRTNTTLNLSARVVNRADPNARLFFQHDFNAFSSNSYALSIAPSGLLSTAYVRSEGAVEQVLSALGQGSDSGIALPEAGSLPDDDDAVSALGRPAAALASPATSIREASQTNLGSVRCAARALLETGCVLETDIVMASAVKKESPEPNVRVCQGFDPSCRAILPSSMFNTGTTSRSATNHRIRARVRIDPNREPNSFAQLHTALCSASSVGACALSLVNFVGSPQNSAGLTVSRRSRQEPENSVQAANDCTGQLRLLDVQMRWSRSCASFVFYRSHLPVPVVLEAYYPILGCADAPVDCWQPIGYGVAHIARQDEVLAIDHRSAPVGSNALGLQFQQGRLIRFGTDQPAFAGSLVASPFAIVNAVLEVPQNLFDFSGSDSSDTSGAD